MGPDLESRTQVLGISNPQNGRTGSQIPSDRKHPGITTDVLIHASGCKKVTSYLFYASAHLSAPKPANGAPKPSARKPSAEG
jgi:hypothetical protein